MTEEEGLEKVMPKYDHAYQIDDVDDVRSHIIN